MEGIAGRGGFRKGREVDFPAVFLPFQLRTFFSQSLRTGSPKMIPSAVSSTNSLSTIEFFSRVILEGDPRLYFSRTSASPKPVVIPSITALRKLSWYVVRDWVCSIKTLLFWASKSSTACAKESSSLCYTTLCNKTIAKYRTWPWPHPWQRSLMPRFMAWLV